MRGMLNELVLLFYGGCLHLRVFIKRGSTVYSCLKCLTVYSECIISEEALLSHIHSRGSGKPDAGDYCMLPIDQGASSLTVAIDCHLLSQFMHTSTKYCGKPHLTALAHV